MTDLLPGAVITDPQHVRMAEALLFAAAEPLDEASIRKRLPDDVDVVAVLAELQAQYAGRGVVLGRVAGRWAFHTAPDLTYLLEDHRHIQRKLSRAAIETLAIIAYHQPVTRAEIEEIRGVSLSKGTLDVLLETNWVRLRGRRRAPGRPVTYGTADEFLIHFGLEDLRNLPGLDELRAAGLLEGRPTGLGIFADREPEAVAEDPLAEDDDGREYLDPLPDPEADTAPEEAAAEDEEEGISRPDIDPLVEDEEPAAADEVEADPVDAELAAAEEVASLETEPMPVTAEEIPEIEEKPEPEPEIEREPDIDPLPEPDLEIDPNPAPTPEIEPEPGPIDQPPEDEQPGGDQNDKIDPSR